MGIEQWSATPASNTQANPVGFDGDRDRPSDLEGWAWDKMGSVRQWYEVAEWIDYGTTPVYVSATTFTLATDLTAFFQVGRRIKLYGSTMGTFYGTISSSTYSSPNTTVVVNVDNGDVLTNNLSRVWYGILSAISSSIPSQAYQNANLVVAGDFRTAPWQQGTTFAAFNDGAYATDNWIAISDGNGIFHVEKDLDGTCKFSVDTINKQFGFVQLFEFEKIIPMLDYGHASIIIDMKGSNLTNIRCALLAWTGTTDAPTRDVVATWAGGGTDPTWAANYTAENTPTDLVLTSSYTEYKISNIILNTSSTKNLALVIWTDDTTITSGATLNIRRVKLEPAQTATEFNYISPNEAFNECSRYYDKTFSKGVAPAQGIGSLVGALNTYTVTAAAQLYGETWFFKNELRTIPTIGTYNPRAGAANSYWMDINGGAGGDSTAGIITTSTKSTTILIDAAGAGNYYYIHATADARL